MKVFETERLYIRKAEPTKQDIDNYYHLWNSGEVMKLVGFPEGLGISREEIDRQFREQSKTEFDSRLAIFRKVDNNFIGECKLGFTNEKGTSSTDVKLLPEFWGKSYGKEIKYALCDYLFQNTDCQIVEATPNKLNIASQKMQDYCGGKRVGEGIFPEPKISKVKRTAVHFYCYHINKSDFQRRKNEKNRKGKFQLFLPII